MDRSDAMALAEALPGAHAWHSGGNIWLVHLTNSKGNLVVFDEYQAVEYADWDAFNRGDIQRQVHLEPAERETADAGTDFDTDRISLPRYDEDLEGHVVEFARQHDVVISEEIEPRIVRAVMEYGMEDAGFQRILLLYLQHHAGSKTRRVMDDLLVSMTGRSIAHHLQAAYRRQKEGWENEGE